MKKCDGDKRDCQYCKKCFDIEKDNPGQEYCSLKCWESAHELKIEG